MALYRIEPNLRDVKRHIEQKLLFNPLSLVRSTGLSGTLADSVMDQSGSVVGVGLGVDLAARCACIDIMTMKRSGLTAGVVAQACGIAEKHIRVTRVGKIKPRLGHRHSRPVPGGVSVGHVSGSTGTLGCLVGDGAGAVYILSNNHVLAAGNHGEFGDPIYQPGPGDGGKAKDTIGELHTYLHLDPGGMNEVDAALARPHDGVVTPVIRDIGRVAGIATPRVGMTVQKSGRSTGVTLGQIVAVDATISVEFGNQNVLFVNQIVIDGIAGPFSKDGDSGSLVMDGARNAVGLLFAGSPGGRTYANPIVTVLTQLGVGIII